MLLGLLLKDTAIEHSAHIVLAQQTILGPEQEVNCKP
jgi:hypothetical protein